MKFTTLIASGLTLIGVAHAHLMMSYPPPFSDKEGRDQHPMDENAVNDAGVPDPLYYPCAVRGFNSAPTTTLKAGEQSHIQILGSAVHGGGSCQIAVSFDDLEAYAQNRDPANRPTFFVIKSYHGACPVENGNANFDPDIYRELPKLLYTLPANMPNGKATLAWSWFNRIGNREWYMRCAPIEVTGGTGTKESFIKNRPTLFMANLPGVSPPGCATIEGQDIAFPHPGDDVETKGTTGSGSGCDASNGAPISTGESGSTQPDQGTPKENNGDVEEEVIVKPDPTSTEVVEVTATAAPDTPAEDAPKEDTPAKDPPAKNPPAKNPPANDSPAPTPVEQPPTRPTLAAPTATINPPSGSCVDGRIYCNGDYSFYLCNHGKLVDMGKVAAGTICLTDAAVKGSSIQAIKEGSLKKRNMHRFKSAHIRRRHYHGHRH